MRIQSKKMQQVLSDVLRKYGFSDVDAEQSAALFVQNSVDGVYSHGYIRFPRVISYLEKGYIKPEAKPSVEGSFGSIERWNGNLGMGNLIAKQAMDRAIDLARENGMGCVAIRNTNHWMRGGTFGWQAAEAGFIGLCFTNTQPNMPAWGASDRRIGNNPFVLAIPRKSGEHVVVDCAMAQYSYGKIEEAKLSGRQLPYPGGFDKYGNLTSDPVAIEKTWRVLPIGYWKGSSLSIAFDLIAAILSGGNSVSAVGQLGGDEYAVSQVVIAIDPNRLGTEDEANMIIDRALADLSDSHPVDEGSQVMYPGQRTYATRRENMEQGIPVNEDVWHSILSFLED